MDVISYVLWVVLRFVLGFDVYGGVRVGESVRCKVEERNEKSCGLAFVGEVVYLMAVPKSDNLLLAAVTINKYANWKGLVKKGDLHIGDLCVVFLPDSVLPHEERFSFMEKYQYRVRMQRYRGECSECLIMPLWFDEQTQMGLAVGDDITSELGVKKYEKPLPKALCGNILRRLPSYIPRTDEPNYQQVDFSSVFAKKDRAYYITEKLDGTSTTAYRWNGHFGVCSRNWEIAEDDHNAYWKVANKYNLRETLPEGYALQWETCGPAIQCNPLRLKNVDGFAFDVYDIANRKYLTMRMLIMFCNRIGFPVVRILRQGKRIDAETLLIYAKEEAKGFYENGKNREGVIVRCQRNLMGRRISFKVLNIDYDH